MLQVFIIMNKRKANSRYQRQIESLIPWGVPLLIIIIWQLLSTVGIIPTRILPAPLDVVKVAFLLTANGELPRNIGISSQRAIIGFLIGGSIGFILGLLNGVSSIADKLLDTSIQMLRNIPNLALIPLVILWFGIGEEARLFLIALGVMFPVYINTYYGIKTIDPGLIEMGKVYGLNKWSLFRQIILPGALPSILVGVRYALGVMWLVLIVAETLGADSGIGYMAITAREFVQTDIVVLSILLYALLGKIADVMAKVLENYCLQWHPNYQKR